MSGHDDEHHHPSAWGPHDWSHGAPHNSWAPLIMSIGFGIFLFMLAGAFTNGIFDASYVPLVFVGLLVSLFGLIILDQGPLSINFPSNSLSANS